MQRQLSFIDRLICSADQALRTMVPSESAAKQASPGDQQQQSELSAEQTQHIAGLMRINHSGEVCAQALYQGQALTAKLPDVRTEMEAAAQEEIDHLIWCEQRIKQLGSHTSFLNPAFYAASFTLGAAAGLAGDKWSLGFVAATEEQVCKHLQDHLEQLPEADKKSRAILQQMLADEARHGENALAAGGEPLPEKIKTLMTAMSKVMTTTTYQI